ncbi:MAG: hypothetical protein CMC56_05040 [Flavobacteriaceae bacterium]|nr:hypothetical protein [Flavobacteriaceae bacterium]
MKYTNTLADTKDKLNYEYLKGKTKEETIELLGLCYNDIHTDVWMYRISYQVSFFRKNYLYLYFAKNRIHGIELKRFRTS